MQKEIVEFIAKCHLGAFCVCSFDGASADDAPKKANFSEFDILNGLNLHPFSAFYAYDKSGQNLIVATDSKTEHGMVAKNNNKILQNAGENLCQIAGIIAPDTKVVSHIQGVQIRGQISPLNKNQTELANLYYKRFPYALAMRPNLCKIQLDWVKFTDNLAFFGRKITWQR